MNIKGLVAVVTGGASGLGRATAEKLVALGAGHVVITDLATSNGEAVAKEIGDNVDFIAGDVTSEEDMTNVFAAATEKGALRAVVHCAGHGGAMRIIDKDGNAGSLELYTKVVNTNLIGSFNVLRLAAVAMMKADAVDGERGIVVMTASVAAYEGQIGQIPYASAKAGIVGMTLVAARDLATKNIRVCTIAPGLFDTPILARVSDDVKDALGKSTPNPARLGRPEEYALMASQIIENPMLNGETIRLDGALRMPPR